jgi:ornithine cyclodeaminase
MSKQWDILYLSQEDCVAADGTDMAGALKAAERSFFLHGMGDFILPGKPVIRWGGPETEETTGRIMSMPCFLGGEQYREELLRRGLLGPVNTSGIKFIPSRPSNPSKHGLPRASAIIVIVDPETLIPVCVMDGAIASAMRTGAASGVAAKYLANPDSKVMGLVGAGVQGRTQLAAMKSALPSLEVCKVCDVSLAAAEKFARDMAPRADVEIAVVGGAEDAFAGSDVVCTATMARESESYVRAEWIKEGAFHAEISFWDTPARVLAVFDRIFVDDWQHVKHHGVDVTWRAVRDGVIAEDRICGNLGEVVTGAKPGRLSPKDRILFNPIGLGIHDLSEAFRVYCNAKAMGIGRTLPLWQDPNAWLDRIGVGMIPE